MRYNLIFNILGLISKYVGIMFIIPMVAAIILGEYEDIIPFFYSFVIASFIGFIFSFKKTSQKNIDTIKKSESLTTVFFAWILFTIICAIPYLFYDFSITNAFFEAMSGTTTTGGTVIVDFSLYPKTLFFFRSLTQWFGGMGIVVLFIAVLPKIAVAGRQMFFVEVPAPTEDKATPRIRYTASWLWGIYLTYTVIEVIVLKLLKVDTYNAIITALSTISTGGFSALPNSIKEFQDTRVAICVLFFMFIAGINYLLIYRGLKNRKTAPLFKSEELRAYVGIILFISILLSTSLIINSHYSVNIAVLHSFFEVVATMTSSGFAIDNYIQWDAASKVILFLAFFTGGCATSTSGGVKIIRLVFIAKYLKRELNKIIHPAAVYPITLENSAINRDIISQMIAFIIFYIVIFGISAFLIVLIENNTTIALSSSAAALGNIGPGYGTIGPMGNFNDLSIFTKWILILLMLIGRLEIIPFLAILNKDLWKD